MNAIPCGRYFIENALYWLEEYQLDGLRFDAIDNVVDKASNPELMVEIGRRLSALSSPAATFT